MTKKREKEDIYNTDRFSSEQLGRMYATLKAYAEGMGGLPQHHSEVFEKRGWLLPFLFAYDELLWGRWEYWLDICHKGTIEGSGPIPQIEWAGTGMFGGGIEETKKMLAKCLDVPSWRSNTLDDFADWLLWGLAATKEPPKIDEKTNEHFYKHFDLFLVLNSPIDYLSYVLCDETGRGYKSGLGYFPTPFHVTLMMTQMTFSDEDPEKHKKKTINEPCVGCGAMLLPASNYVLRGYGQDISGIAVKLAKIQMYWYAPWFAFHPNNIKGFEEYEPTIRLSKFTGKRKIPDGQQMFELV